MKSGDKRKEPKKQLDVVSDEVILKSGLAIMPVDPNKLNIFGILTSGLMKHHVFTIRTKVKEDLRTDELYCHVVEECKKSIAIRPYQVKGIADEKTYLAEHSSGKIESASYTKIIEKALELQFQSQSKARQLLWVPLLLAKTSRFLLFCFQRLIEHDHFQVGNFWLVQRTYAFTSRSP